MKWNSIVFATSLLTLLTACKVEYGINRPGGEAAAVQQGPSAPAGSIVTGAPAPEDKSCLTASLVQKDLGVLGSEAHGKYLAKSEYKLGTSVSRMSSDKVGIDLKRIFHFPDISITPRMATGGYPDEHGHAIRDRDHKIISEYLLLDFKGFIGLKDIDEEGVYEIALMSDDGAVLEVNVNGQWQVLVDNDRKHAVRFACAKDLVKMSGDMVLPYRLSYFQGPKNHIANMLMWRKVSDSTPSEAECGKSGQFFFFDPKTSSAKKPYEELIQRGWQIVPQENLVVPSSRGADHPCFQISKR